MMLPVGLRVALALIPIDGIGNNIATSSPCAEKSSQTAVLKVVITKRTIAETKPTGRQSRTSCQKAI